MTSNLLKTRRDLARDGRPMASGLGVAPRPFDWQLQIENGSDCRHHTQNPTWPQRLGTSVCVCVRRRRSLLQQQRLCIYLPTYASHIYNNNIITRRRRLSRIRRNRDRRLTRGRKEKSSSKKKKCVWGKKRTRNPRGDMMSTWNQKMLSSRVPRVSRFGIINYFGNAREYHI